MRHPPVLAGQARQRAEHRGEGVGPERTLIEIHADPTVTRNTHTITVDSDSARFTMTIENIPSENPKTGRIVAQSVVALLRKMRANLRVGT